MVAVLVLLGDAGCNSACGCGQGDHIAKTAEFRDKMCACKTAACVTKVATEIEKWNAEYKRDVPTTKFDPEDAKKLAQLRSDTSVCQLAMSPPTH